MEGERKKCDGLMYTEHMQCKEINLIFYYGFHEPRGNELAHG